MYRLTLTSTERRAIDWIGHRYATGDDFRELLFQVEWEGREEWDCLDAITFLFPEHIAWEADRLFSLEEYTFPCFAPCLSSKLMDWVGEIV